MTNKVLIKLVIGSKGYAVSDLSASNFYTPVYDKFRYSRVVNYDVVLPVLNWLYKHDCNKSS